MKCRGCSRVLNGQDRPECRVCVRKRERSVTAYWQNREMEHDLGAAIQRWVMRRRCIEAISPETAAVLDDLMTDLGINA